MAEGHDTSEETPSEIDKKIGASDIKLAPTWSEWRESNPRPLGPEPSALPTALHPDTANYYTEYETECQGYIA